MSANVGRCSDRISLSVGRVSRECVNWPLSDEAPFFFLCMNEGGMIEKVEACICSYFSSIFILFYFFLLLLICRKIIILRDTETPQHLYQSRAGNSPLISRVFVVFSPVCAVNDGFRCPDYSSRHLTSDQTVSQCFFFKAAVHVMGRLSLWPAWAGREVVK